MKSIYRSVHGGMALPMLFSTMGGVMFAMLMIDLSHYVVAGSAVQEAVTKAMRCVVPTDPECVQLALQAPSQIETPWEGERIVASNPQAFLQEVNYSVSVNQQVFENSVETYSVNMGTAQASYSDFEIPVSRFVARLNSWFDVRAPLREAWYTIDGAGNQIVVHDSQLLGPPVYLPHGLDVSDNPALAPFTNRMRGAEWEFGTPVPASYLWRIPGSHSNRYDINNDGLPDDIFPLAEQILNGILPGLRLYRVNYVDPDDRKWQYQPNCDWEGRPTVDPRYGTSASPYSIGVGTAPQSVFGKSNVGASREDARPRAVTDEPQFLVVEIATCNPNGVLNYLNAMSPGEPLSPFNSAAVFLDKFATDELTPEQLTITSPWSEGLQELNYLGVETPSYTPSGSVFYSGANFGKFYGLVSAANWTYLQNEFDPEYQEIRYDGVEPRLSIVESRNPRDGDVNTVTRGLCSNWVEVTEELLAEASREENRTVDTCSVGSSDPICTSNRQINRGGDLDNPMLFNYLTRREANTGLGAQFLGENRLPRPIVVGYTDLACATERLPAQTMNCSEQVPTCRPPSLENECENVLDEIEARYANAQTPDLKNSVAVSGLSQTMLDALEPYLGVAGSTSSQFVPENRVSFAFSNQSRQMSFESFNCSDSIRMADLELSIPVGGCNDSGALPAPSLSEWEALLPNYQGDPGNLAASAASSIQAREFDIAYPAPLPSGLSSTKLVFSGIDEPFNYSGGCFAEQDCSSGLPQYSSQEEYLVDLLGNQQGSDFENCSLLSVNETEGPWQLVGLPDGSQCLPYQVVCEPGEVIIDELGLSAGLPSVCLPGGTHKNCRALTEGIEVASNTFAGFGEDFERAESIGFGELLRIIPNANTAENCSGSRCSDVEVDIDASGLATVRVSYNLPLTPVLGGILGEDYISVERIRTEPTELSLVGRGLN